MNERLQEFVKDHLVHSEYTEFGWQECHRYELDTEELEKFIKLIVIECDNIMEKYSYANMESDAWVEMITMMQKDLKKHFGVEK